MKYLFIVCIHLSISCLYISSGQNIKPIIKHEFDIGTTGNLYTHSGATIHYQRIDRDLYLYTGGRRTGSAFLLFIPYFSFHYTRYIDDHAFSIGYTYFSNSEFLKSSHYYNYFMALKLGYQSKDVIPSKWISLRPALSIQFNKSYADNIYLGQLPEDKIYQYPKYGAAFGLGFTSKLYLKQKVFLVNNFEFVYNSSLPHFFIQHYIGIGYRF
ncbi:MAG: hypothetical protein IPO92_00425 [Saprospiraceae bacterium]|nr:hypothetical protein [Saprospiraceae bacterium]